MLSNVMNVQEQAIVLYRRQCNCSEFDGCDPCKKMSFDNEKRYDIQCTTIRMIGITFNNS